MKINIANIGTLEWLNFKSDISYGLYHGLSALGHDVGMTINEFASDRLNLIIGADFIVTRDDLIEALKPGIDFAIYEVEYFNGSSINFRHFFKIDAYGDLVQRAQFLMTPYQVNVQSYQDFGANTDIRYTPWGFYPELLSSNVKRQESFDYDALFFGLLKGLRKSKMAALEAQLGSKVKVMGRDDPQTFKDYFMSCSKWGVSLAYGQREKFVNPFRLYQMAANGMPVLADNTVDDDGYTQICERVSFDGLLAAVTGPLPDMSNLAERVKARSLSDTLRQNL